MDSELFYAKGQSRSYREKYQGLTLTLTLSLFEGEKNASDFHFIFRAFSDVEELSVENLSDVIRDVKAIILSGKENGSVVAAIIRKTARFPQESRKELLEDTKIILSKLEDTASNLSGDIEQFFDFVDQLKDKPREERITLFTSTINIFNKPTIWSDIRDVLNVMKPLASPRQKELAKLLEGRFDSCGSSSLFLYTFRGCFYEE